MNYLLSACSSSNAPLIASNIAALDTLSLHSAVAAREQAPAARHGTDQGHALTCSTCYSRRQLRLCRPRCCTQDRILDRTEAQIQTSPARGNPHSMWRAPMCLSVSVEGLRRAPALRHCRPSVPTTARCSYSSIDTSFSARAVQ